MTFLSPLNALIPRIPFSFLPILGLGHLRGPGVSLGRILGVLSIEPFLGEGGGLARGLYQPPPLQLKARLPQTRIRWDSPRRPPLPPDANNPLTRATGGDASDDGCAAEFGNELVFGTGRVRSVPCVGPLSDQRCSPSAQGPRPGACGALRRGHHHEVLSAPRPRAHHPQPRVHCARL